MTKKKGKRGKGIADAVRLPRFRKNHRRWLNDSDDDFNNVDSIVWRAVGYPSSSNNIGGVHGELVYTQKVHDIGETKIVPTFIEFDTSGTGGRDRLDDLRALADDIVAWVDALDEAFTHVQEHSTHDHPNFHRGR